MWVGETTEEVVYGRYWMYQEINQSWTMTRALQCSGEDSDYQFAQCRQLWNPLSV